MNKILFLFVLLLLLSGAAAAQDTLMRATVSQGGAWMITDNGATFVSVGQPAVSSSLTSDDEVWEGTVGFIGPVLNIGNNNAPVAFGTDFPEYIEIGDAIELEGFDPDGDAITFEILTQPQFVTITPQLDEGFFDFVPNEGLTPGTLYEDVLSFQVSDGELVSEEAFYNFEFIFEDTEHQIVSFSFAESAIQLSWEDLIKNDGYQVEVSYYDLSDITSPSFKTLIDDSFSPDQLVSDGNLLSTSSAVSSETDPYLFDADLVFIIALVTTENGNSSFEAFVLDNTAGGRVLPSEDGLFFTYGSSLSVIENGQVDLSLFGVELNSDFSISTAIIEVIDNPHRGSLETPVEVEASETLKEWSATYTATEENGGVDSIQFRVFNSDRQLFDTAWVQVTIVDVNDPPTIASIDDRAMQEEDVLSFAIEIEDPDNEFSVFVESNEKSSVPVTYADGVIEISPIKDFEGLVSIDVVVSEVGTDEGYVVSERFDVEVIGVDDPPVVNAIDDITIDEDNTLTLTASATDPDATLSVFSYFVQTSDPSLLGAEINGNIIQVVPGDNVNGVFNVSVFADDGLGTAASVSEAETFELTVTPVNDAPTIVQQFPVQQITQDFPDYMINLEAYFTDVENGANLAYSFSGNSNIVLSENDNVLTIAPQDNFNSSEEVTITASDGELTVAQNITFLFVEEDPNIVVAKEIGTLSFSEDFGQETFDASDVFQDVTNNNAVFEYSISGAETIVTSISSEGVITFQSASDFFGTETMFLFASLNGSVSFTEFVVDVSPVNDAPVISEVDDITLDEDQTLSGIFIPVADVDNEITDLQVSFESSNTSLIAVDGISSTTLSDGFSLSIAPIANAFGQTSIKVIVGDGAMTNTTEFQATVSSINDVPVVAVSTVDDATEDQAYSLDLATLFTDDDNDVLVYTVTGLPGWLTNSSNTLAGTPLNSDVGSVAFSVVADDGNGGSVIQDYALAVINVNDAPIVANGFENQDLFEDFGVKEYSLEGVFTDDDNDAVSITTSSSNTGVVTAIIKNGNTLEITEVANGESDITLTGDDGNGGTATNTFKIVVNNVNDAPIVVNETADQQLDQGFSTLTLDLAGTFSDEDGDAVSISATSQDVNIVTVATSGNSLTITEAGVGTTSIQVVGTDGNGGETSYSFSVTVTARPPLGLIGTVEASIFPNPTTDYVTIRTRDGAMLDVRLTDTSGKVLLRTLSLSGESLDVSQFQSGLYFIIIRDENNVSTKKLMIK